MPFAQKTWVDNEVITDVDLNRMEQGITDASTPADGSITTAKLAANAVSKISSGSVTGTTISTTSTSFVDLHANTSLSVTTSGGDLLILAIAGPMLTTNANTNVTLGVLVNATDYVAAVCQQGGANGQYGNVWGNGAVLVTGLAAGTYDIKLRMRASSGTSDNYLISNAAGYARIVVMEIKR